MATPTFQRSEEVLTGSVSILGMQYYVHEDIKGTEPSVDVLSAPPPGIVSIFRASADASAESLRELGEAARAVIDESLPETGAVLLRGIPARTAEEFSIFWQGCKKGKSDRSWEEALYINFGRPRKKVAGVDSATNIPPELSLNPHNELSYNPVQPSRICLYCIQPSKSGGESIIARNEDITDQVPQELAKYIEDHGGVMYERSYRDANNVPNTDDGDTALSRQLAISWQDKCGGVETREEAEQYWVDHGFQREHVIWEKDGTLRVRNIESGFIKDSKLGKRLWFNNLDTVGECPDGTGRPPRHLLQQFQADRWKAVYAWRLQTGDWLVLDNLRMQHGRLPYPSGEERRLLTVLVA